MSNSRPIRERFPPPWRLEPLPGGYRVTDAHGTPLVYVYAVEGGARSALPNSLTPSEAQTIAMAVIRLPELIPAA
jgi:hypothetical protein